jgi:hypothetical protein
MNGIPNAFVFIERWSEHEGSPEILEARNANESDGRLQIITEYSYFVGSPWSRVSASRRLQERTHEY